ncbi:RagB/SusD family nutrient uptake outer membrane protein [Pedobacter metabolipauper]|uniref:RagB/SusD domain-containing protein n=1 Tax=Pedobacter metabolipauper TaxID=425513 RepID=A0A4R6SZS8_9SPHI|nr:RagB/SusD family nutrient uptake outer membrane protein [Pedobacter metabolipauper]TDQ10272.1 RagB/SusD domain-containing protein [Pedobacter metabolipauper]
MKYNIFKISLILIIIFFQFSCKKIIQIDVPKDSVVQETIFQNNDAATSVMTGIYRSMSNNGFASGNNMSITSSAGLTADEFSSHSTLLKEFYDNELNPLTTNISSLYASPYETIYATNVLLEGLEGQNNITLPNRTQLRGEALFIRAFAYFYLVNMFGSVPLHITSDYRVTRIASRTTVTEIYKQIISDLKTAENLLKDTYITTERIRPNLSTVQALLARTYLYTQDWENAEKYATLVINKTSIYNLVNVDAIFLKNSQEAIWQLMPTTASGNTNEGTLLILTGTPTNLSLNSDFALNSFEANDERKNSWIRSYTNATGTYYYPFKYKARTASPVTEYYMVMRLAEQFLIRAEARVQQKDISGAIDDIDKIRNRAGITLIKNTNPNISANDLSILIQKERRVELFSEWGHRWFDLKRSGNATAVLSLVKPMWQATDVFYPIPQREIDLNSNITQNVGY